MADKVKFAVRETRDTAIGMLRPGILYQFDESAAVKTTLEALTKGKNIISEKEFKEARAAAEIPASKDAKGGSK